MPSFSRGKIQNPLAPQASPPDPGTTSSRTATQDLRAYPGSCLRILLTPGKKLRVTIMTFNLDLLPQPDPSDVGESVEVLWVGILSKKWFLNNRSKRILKRPLTDRTVGLDPGRTASEGQSQALNLPF